MGGCGCTGFRSPVLCLGALATILAACASARPLPADPVARDRDPLTGGCGVMRSELRPQYLLPFPTGSRYRLTQGNCGNASHTGRFRYSFDFQMPIGSPVVAARVGIVRRIRDDGPDGTNRLGDENFVIIDHGDGEMSRYIHLAQRGSRVELGESVGPGDTIALSGHSGRSAFPHLHFDVVSDCGSGRCTTIPAAFLDALPPIPTEPGLYGAAGGDRGPDGLNRPGSRR